MEVYSLTPTATSSRNMCFGFSQDKMTTVRGLDKKLLAQSLFAEKESKNLDETIKKIKYIMN